MGWGGGVQRFGSSYPILGNAGNAHSYLAPPISCFFLKRLYTAISWFQGLICRGFVVTGTVQGFGFRVSRHMQHGGGPKMA